MMRLLLASLFVLIFPNKIFAYLDPGSGSYFFQIAIGLIIGVMYTIKLYWQKIKDAIHKRFESENTPTESQKD